MIFPYQPSTRTSIHAIRTSGAFTLIELIVTISIIIILGALSFPAIGKLRESAKIGETKQMILHLQAAVEEYQMEDKRRKLPTPEPDHAFWHGGNTASIRLLNRLEQQTSYRTPLQRLAGATGERQLTDPWNRPLRYTADQNMDGTADRPAAASDWNPLGKEPYAYIWSIGPVRSEDTDSLADNVKHWIYTKESAP